MHIYNTKDFLKTVLSLHKTDTLKLLFPTMLLVGLYSYGIAYLEIEYLDLTSKSTVTNDARNAWICNFAFACF